MASPAAAGVAPLPSAWWSVRLVAGPGVVIWWRAACALVVALAVQVGTNYANDYSDGVRGTDAASGSARCAWSAPGWSRRRR